MFWVKTEHQVLKIGLLFNFDSNASLVTSKGVFDKRNCSIVSVAKLLREKARELYSSGCERFME
jgi:hypothetical protein